MIKITMTICGVLLASSVYADGNATKGKKIFAASECVRCHQTNKMFTRSDKKVKTLTALDSQVRKCDSQLSTNLFDDEIKDVVAYLNQAHYKFTVKKNLKEESKTEKTKKTKEVADEK
jgi:mono/diheme cytochrome c family protein